MKLFKLGLMALLVTTLSLACNDDEDDTPKSIAAIVAEDDRFSTLESALNRVGLTSVLESGTFTVFAPTNSAFTALGVDLNTLTDAQLTNILLYHVLGAKVTSTDLQEGDTYASTASTGGPGGTQLTLYINKTSGAVKVNGNAARVTDADVSATNGVIHIVDGVLLPLDVVGHASANPNFSQLVGALGSASGNLVPTLQGSGPFTVFAPVNSAFQAISGVVSGLTADQLRDVLLYHVVSGNVRSSTLSNNQVVNPLLGGTSAFTIKINGSAVTITDGAGNTANVVLTDVQGTNGVIHVIDKVILPN